MQTVQATLAIVQQQNQMMTAQMEQSSKFQEELRQAKERFDRGGSLTSQADPSSSAPGAGGSAGRPMDSKWLPPMPVAAHGKWHSRVQEISGFISWLEAFTSWVSLLHEKYADEIRHVVPSSNSWTYRQGVKG